jgi:Flp pilus assembly protein TadD
LKKSFAIATIALVLSACANLRTTGNASAAEPSADIQDATPAASAAQFTTQRVSLNTMEGTLPHAQLDEATLFKILSAEIAYQRGQWQASYVTLLSLAQQTQDPRLAKRAAEVAITARNQAEALTAVRLWSELAPNSEEALQNHVGLLILANNTEEVRNLLSARLQKSPPQTRGILILKSQRMVANLKDSNAAFALMESITAPYDGLLETHLALAQSAYMNRDVQRARTEAERALTIKPDSELAILTLAQILPNTQEATQRVGAFLQRYPNAKEVRIAYARELIEQKQYAQALPHFETLLQQNPSDLTALYALGVIHIQLKQWDKADLSLRRYLGAISAEESGDDPVLDGARDPDSVRVLLSQIAEERGDFKGAMGWLSLNAPTFETQIRRVHLFAKQQDIPAARGVLVQMRKETDVPLEQQQLIQTEAQILREANRDKEAASVLKIGLRDFPDNTNLLYDYAMVTERLGDYKDMEEVLRKVIQLSPNMQHAYNALGYSFAERNIRLNEAHTLIQKAYRLAPNDPFITDSLGWIEYRLGNVSAAETHLRRAYAMRADPEIATHLGEVLWVQNKKEEARQVWQEARQKDPQNRLLKETLTRLNAQ